MWQMQTVKHLRLVLVMAGVKAYAEATSCNERDNELPHWHLRVALLHAQKAVVTVAMTLTGLICAL